jgi:ABC-type uncharacterized transport system permease subunit
MSFSDVDLGTVSIIVVGLAAVILIASLAIASLVTRKGEVRRP